MRHATPSSSLSLLKGQHLAAQALEVMKRRGYKNSSGHWVDLKGSFSRTLNGKRSIPPKQTLSPLPKGSSGYTQISVVHETTLHASRRLYGTGEMPLALNFANGIIPGGGFLLGATAQEESLCRCSGLYRTLLRDPMYPAHQKQGNHEASNWAILSPEVPVFAKEDGIFEEEPWTLGILSCAAPDSTQSDPRGSRLLMRCRIERILHIALHYGYGSLVLGAWGCGAFGNDPEDVAALFADALHGPFAGIFDEVVFAIFDPQEKTSALQAFQKHLGSS